MKILFTSPDALIDKETGDFFPDIIENLKILLEENLLEDVVVISRQADKIDLMPESFIKIKVRGKEKRDGTYLKEIMRYNPELEHEDIIILGASESDFYMSANSKYLLFTAKYAKSNNRGGKIFKYGIPIETPQYLIDFFRQFLPISHHCYYELEVDSNTYLYAINSANYYYSSDTKLVSIKRNIERFLKENNPALGRTFLNYFLMSAYNKIGDLREIDYWGVYPSSNANTWNEDLVAFKEEARKIYKTREQEEIFIRKSNARKRHQMNKRHRKDEGCNSQFNTIILNPKYKGKLKGKTVCIIDDFTTYGSSCETSRILLNKEGIKKLVFITMGKFGKEYFKQYYEIEGNVSDDYTYKRIKQYKVIDGRFYSDANKELKQIFGNITL